MVHLPLQKNRGAPKGSHYHTIVLLNGYVRERGQYVVHRA
jgi:hypothetical protein